ncbi:uncharacterized protein LOC129884409 [Solanum dulcamara]|uniref:uncharacterized protein LOC129884409 n=1 Tax=Solanum dulcamara TaxID=45834 RepID=UPI0024863D45|nr:uncharacterized protein LOC129884409 [Solanum dulcamara]
MPKVKRFKNPRKFANGHASSSTTSAALPDASTIPLQAHEVPQQEQAPILLQEEQAPIPPQQAQVPILPSNSSVTSMSRRIYSKYWNVDARCEAQGLLAVYCGSLAVDCNLFPISFERWSGPLGMPKKYMEDCFETILKVSESSAYRYCNASISKKWSTHRQRLWNEYFDPAKSKNEILSNVPPSTMLCRGNKEIQRMQKMSHTGDSKANSRRRYELFLKTGKTHSRGKMFIETHKRRNGSFVNDEARIIGMLGTEHSGRVRCMGMGAAPSNTFLNTKRLSELSISSSSYGASSTNSTYLHQKVAHLESQLEGTLTALKDYMISKDGRVPEEFASLFSPHSQPADAENDHVSPVDIRGSLVDNNTNHQSNA